jgi:hypothetical protein
VTGNCLGFPDAIADEADAIEAGDEESPLWKPIISVAGLYELCWTQPVDRFVACDRAKDHKGKHSWELPS